MSQQQSQVGQGPRRIMQEDALNADIWDVDASPHIEVDADKCADCSAHPCILFCPAGAFTLLGDRILYSYEGCLECGTCRVVCPKRAITWDYPLSGRGVQYRFG
jgi:ferredoxin like protein